MKRLPLGLGRLVFPAGWLVAGALRLGAQDVSLAPLQWQDAGDPPQELPAVQSKIAFPFPAELAATPDIGYVIVDAVLDGKGKVLSFNPRGTQLALERTVGVDQGRWKFSPARRDGKGVNSAITFGVIFNPKSAAANAPDATPRLLEADVVRLRAAKGAESSKPPADQVVLADLTLDETGRIVDAKNVPEGLAEPVAVALKNWKFAPARRAGQSVGAQIRVPLVATYGVPLAGAGGTPPKAISQVPPVYPFAMRLTGLRGEVTIEFLVDIEGRVRNPVVVRSLNPAFDDPALEALRKWRFEPGQKAGRPVVTRMQVPIVFQLSGLPKGGGDGLMQTKKADLAKLPEELRYDTPPRMLGSIRPVYPYGLLGSGKSGKATIRFFVDERGEVLHPIVGEASSPEFGQALLAAVEHFSYEPAQKGGKPGKAVMGFAQEFSTDEAQQIVSQQDLDLLRREQKRPQSIVGPAEIDGKLKIMSQRPPRFPLALADKTDRGEAMVEFIVDEEGRARLPRAISASEEAFGYAAVQGVATWRFEPPTRGGRAVAVRVRAPIRFALGGPGAADTKK